MHEIFSLNSISGETRSRFQEWESKFQSVKRAYDFEIIRIIKAISNLEAKITSGLANNNRTAIQQTDMVKTTTVG